MNQVWILVCALAAMCLLLMTVAQASDDGRLDGKRVLLINSYHRGYVWSDSIVNKAFEVLETRGVHCRVHYMNTQSEQSPDLLEEAGNRAFEAFQDFKPDVVIVSDDNAQRHFVVPHLYTMDIPVVFCGVNWDISEYGYPTRNITGMIEVEQPETLLLHLRRCAKGNRVGLISDDTFSERKTADYYNGIYFNGQLRTWFSETFEEFKRAYLQAQEECDMLILQNNATIRDWNSDRAREFILGNTNIPTGSFLWHMAPYSLFNLRKLPEEQGEWAANAALMILQGKSPSDIPVTTNKRSYLTVNMAIAREADIMVTLDSLKAASKVMSMRDLIRFGAGDN